MSIVIGQSSATLQYVRVAVKAMVAGAPYDPTADVVKFGFQNEATYTSSTPPTSSGWYTASWETTLVGGITTYVAKCLVGPGGTFAPASDTNYWLWLMITDSPEIPVLFVGELRVT